MKPRYLLLGVALAAVVGAAQAQAPGKSGKFDPFSEGAKSGKFDTYTDGARAGKFDPYTDGAKSGKFDPYSDGAKQGTSDNVTALNPGVRTDQMEAIDNAGNTAQRAGGKFDPYTDGAKAGKFDVNSDGAKK